MVYLTGSVSKVHHEVLMAADVGLMAQPGSYGPQHVVVWPLWAADNGCFANAWEATKWERWLRSLPAPGCLFAVVPDVVGDHTATLERFSSYASVVREAGLPVAFVLQEGALSTEVPWDSIDAVFVGGATSWKYSPEIRALVAEARRRHLWAHMGRVNSLKRASYAHWIGCQSVDGTFLQFGPDTNVPRLLEMLRRLEVSPPLSAEWAS